jgi:hypothetical protein
MRCWNRRFTAPEALHGPFKSVWRMGKSYRAKTLAASAGTEMSWCSSRPRSIALARSCPSTEGPYGPSSLVRSIRTRGTIKAKRFVRCGHGSPS